jgi:hypothetical protein
LNVGTVAVVLNVVALSVVSMLTKNSRMAVAGSAAE